MCWWWSELKVERDGEWGEGVNKKQKDPVWAGRKTWSSSSDTEEMLAGDPAEGTSQPLLKVSLQGDDLEDQSLAMEPGWEQEHVFLPL